MTPSLDSAARILKRQEPMRVQALLAQPAVERFNVGVIGRLARPGEDELDPICVGTLIQYLRYEL